MKGVLIVAEAVARKAPTESNAPKNPKAHKAANTGAPAEAAPTPSVIVKLGEGAIFETAGSGNGFSTLVPPSTKAGSFVANHKTSNDPIETLTDGKLAQGFGPIFGNGIKDGAYKMNLGKPQPVTAITSWSHHQQGKRGAQHITLYGSNSADDPGWNVADTAHFTPLGSLTTEGQTLKDFTALSRRSPDVKPLGTFQWIVWQVAPISKQSENTAFQELAVEVGKN